MTTPVGGEASPQTTLAVILGAHEFPRSPNLESTPAFARSAEDFKHYLLDPEGFGLPTANLLDLFDSSKAPSEILEEVCTFLTSRQRELKESGVSDLLVYYTGHGGFTTAREYFLAVSVTRQRMEGATSLRASDLAATIKENARSLRRYLILDCCFSAAAFKEFQSAPLSAARVQIMDSFPKEGTTLLCSSNARTVSIAPSGAKHTMFSGALIDVLQQGTRKIEGSLSMEQLGAQIKEQIQHLYPDEAVRPEVLSPDQRLENIALVPIFPNAATRPRRIKDELDRLSSELGKTMLNINTLRERVQQIGNELSSVPELLSRIEALELRSNETQSTPAKNATAISQWEQEEQILQTAPPPIINEVLEWRRARVAGMCWCCVSSLVIFLNFFLFYRGHGLLSQKITWDPIAWLPLFLLSLITFLNLPWLLSRGGFYEVKPKPVDGPPEPWEKLRSVLATRRARYFRLIGSVQILSPWFEIAYILYLAQAVGFVGCLIRSNY